MQSSLPLDHQSVLSITFIILACIGEWNDHDSIRTKYQKSPTTELPQF